MLKRLAAAVVCLLATLIALVLYWVILMPWMHFPFDNDRWVKMIFAVTVVAIATYIVVRWKSWPSLLLLIGSVPMLLFNISYLGFVWRMSRHDPMNGSEPSWIALIFPSDQENSPVHRILFYISFLLWCLPLSFLWYFFRLADRHLTKR